MRDLQILSFLFLLAAGSHGCELEVLINNALACGMEAGTRFNLTKYSSYIVDLVTESLNYDTAEEFLYDYTFSDMMKVLAELEPASVFLLRSFYDQHLSWRRGEDWIRPMFGDMSDIDNFLTQALDDHCGVLSDLAVCYEKELKANCRRLADAEYLIDLVIKPLKERYCNGDQPKGSTLQWFNDNSEGFTEAFNCLLKDPSADAIEFVDFEKKSQSVGFSFYRVFSKCSAEAFVITGLYDFYYKELYRFFDDIDLSTFDVVDLLEADIPEKFYSIARPMADCMAKEFKVLAARFCPGLSPDDEITKMMKTVKFMLPVFVEEQDYVTEVMLSPRQLELSSNERFMVALLGNLHVYRGDNSEWFATCHIPPDEAYLTVLAASNIEILVNKNSLHLKDLFSSTSLDFYSNSSDVYVSSYGLNGRITDLDMFLQVKILFSWDQDAVRMSMDDGQVVVTNYDLGLVIVIANPTGNNWIVYTRGSKDAYSLTYGFISQGCAANDDTISDIRATSVSNSCTDRCSALQEISVPCAYDCETGFYEQGGMADEYEAIKALDKIYAKTDSGLQNGVNNLYSDTFMPCSFLGLFMNIGVPCVDRSITSGTFPNFTGDTMAEWFTDLGTIEPYTFYAITAFYDKWVIGSPNKPLVDDESSIADIEAMLLESKLKSIFTSHCKFVTEIAQCMRWGVEDFCPEIQDTLKTDYLDLAEQRYCESADQYKEDVVEDMLESRKSLTEPLRCFLDTSLSNRLEFNYTKVEEFMELIIDNCAVEEVIALFMRMVEGAAAKDEILTVIEKVVRTVRNPGQCIVRVVQQICPQLDVADALRDILVHVNRATANVVPEITFEYFIPNTAVDLGDKNRVSMWAVGDPHIKHLGATEFSVCDSPGKKVYFVNDHTHRILMEAVNTQFRSDSNATIITEISIKMYDIGAKYGAQPTATYLAEGGALKTTFEDGSTKVSISGEDADYDITIEEKTDIGIVVIKDASVGLMIAIAPFKNFYNIVVRGARGYVEQASGLIVDGCVDEKEAEIEETEEDNSRRRKRAVPTREECENACEVVTAELRQSCIYDCYTMEDTEVSEAHAAVTEVEEAVVSDDQEVYEWFPPATVEDNAACFLRASLTLAALSLLTVTF